MPATSCSRTIPIVHDLYKLLLGDNVHWQDREAWVYSKSVYTRYPFQGALYGLPPDVMKECIIGAIEARFGSLTAARQPVGARAARAPPVTGRRRARPRRSTIAARTASAKRRRRSVGCRARRTASARPRNFEEFIYQVWGAGVAKHFAIPYNRKLWTVPLTEMETSWLGGRVPLPDLEEMIEGALQPVPKPHGPERALRLSAARRLPGADGRLPAAFSRAS